MRFLVILAFVLAVESAEARKRVVYKIKKPPAVIAKSEEPRVRIISIPRWDLWCERVGGLDCAQ